MSAQTSKPIDCVQVRRSPVFYLLGACGIAIVAAGLYGAAAIGVFRVYFALLVVALAGVAGFLRWDERDRT